MIVLAIDPGSTKAKVSHTGIVFMNGTQLWDSWAVPDGINGFREWYKGSGFYPHHDTPGICYPAVHEPMTVVCEQFVDRQVRGADRSPMLVEGAVRFLWPNVVLQSASGYKTQMPDEQMEKLMGFNAKSFGGDHHADRWAALRHGLLYLKRRHDPTVLEAFR